MASFRLFLTRTSIRCVLKKRCRFGKPLMCSGFRSPRKPLSIIRLDFAQSSRTLDRSECQRKCSIYEGYNTTQLSYLSHCFKLIIATSVKDLMRLVTLRHLRVGGAGFIRWHPSNVYSLLATFLIFLV